MIEATDEIGAIPDVVAGGDDVDAVSVELLDDVVRYAETAGGIFAVGDAQVDGALLDQTGNTLGCGTPTGASIDVGYKEDSQVGVLLVVGGGVTGSSAVRRLFMVIRSKGCFSRLSSPPTASGSLGIQVLCRGYCGGVMASTRSRRRLA